MLATVPGLDMARLVAALGEGDETAPDVAALLARNGERALPELLRALGSGQDRVRDGAVLALTLMGPATWPALVPRLRDPSRQVRLGAARVLAETKWKPYTVREAFAFHAALGDWESVAGMGPAAEPFLIDALGDQNSDVREAAARTLGRSGDSGAVRPLLRLLARDPEEEVREAAAQALGLLADPSAVPGLRAAVDDRSHTVRFAAATALGSLGWSPANDDETVALMIATAQWAALGRLGPVAVPRLVRALGDDHYEIRHGAGETLLALGVAARPALERARTDPDPAVRDEAAALLARMGPAPPAAGRRSRRSRPQQRAASPQRPRPNPQRPPRRGRSRTSPACSTPGARPSVWPRPAPSHPCPRTGPCPRSRARSSIPTRRSARRRSHPSARSPPRARCRSSSTASPIPPTPSVRPQSRPSHGPARRPSRRSWRRWDGPSGTYAPARPAFSNGRGIPAPSGWEELGLTLGLEDWRGLARFGADAVEPLAALLVHPDPDLRLGAVIALGEIGGDRAKHLLRVAGSDPSLAVRHRAALLLQLQRTGSEEA